MHLINPNVVTYKGSVSDEHLKERLIHEAMEQANFLDQDGKPLAGVDFTIKRNGKQHGKGGYLIEVSRDLSKSNQALITAADDPNAGDDQ